MELTEKLDMLMAERNVNRAELSRGTGIPYSTITNFYEKGTDNIKLSTLRKLADYFDVSLDYIADDSVTDRNYGRVKTTIEVDADTTQLLEKTKMLNAEGRRLLSVCIDGLLANKDFLNSHRV